MQSKSQRTTTYILLSLLSALFLLPIIWLALTSLKTPIQAADFMSLPATPQWMNYIDAWKTAGFGDAFINTFEIGLGTVLLSTLAGLPMAYSLVRYTLKGSSATSGGMLALRVIPETVFLLPLYVLFRQTGLFDTKLGMILAFQIVTLPYSIYLLKSFIQGVPEEIENAARIDGCSEFLIPWRITLPLIMPGVLTSAIIAFISVWTSLLFPLTLAYSKAQTVSVAISSFKGYGTFNWPVMAAAAICVTVPQIIMFSLINKYLVAGYTMGAVKE
ncbi:MAG: carbohydrate ABC transporter permease [Anaerolineaceae bacterium]